jgi:hypothetical protein
VQEVVCRFVVDLIKLVLICARSTLVDVQNGSISERVNKEGKAEKNQPSRELSFMRLLRQAIGRR